MIKEFFKATLYKPLFNLLAYFAYLVPGHSIGWAIIGLTLLVRALLWVPSVRALRSPLQLRQYQDEIKAIQEKFKDDRAAQAQATMAFYRQKGVNPLSGCLPALIQLPIIIILYQVFIAGLNNIRPDLIYPFTPHLDTINPYFFGIDLSKPDRIVMPLLAAAGQFAQSFSYSKLNPASANKKANDPAAMMNKQMLYLFPAMTYFIALSLPAGLALYWIATSLFSLVQQVVVVRSFKPNAGAKVTVRQRGR